MDGWVHSGIPWWVIDSKAQKIRRFFFPQREIGAIPHRVMLSLTRR